MRGFYEFNRGCEMLGNGGGWLMMLGAVILIAIIVYVVYKVTHKAHTQITPISESNAVKILDERYAKGELTDEEYKTKKANLQPRE